MTSLLDYKMLMKAKDREIDVAFRKVGTNDNKLNKVRMTGCYYEQDGVIMYRIGKTITYMSEEVIPSVLVSSLMVLDCIDNLYIGGANLDSSVSRIKAKTVTGFCDVVFKKKQSDVFIGRDTTKSRCKMWFSNCTVELIDANGMDWEHICGMYMFISKCFVDRLNMSGMQLNNGINVSRIAAGSKIGNVDFGCSNLDAEEPNELFSDCEIDTVNMRDCIVNIDKLAKLLIYGDIKVVDISRCKIVSGMYKLQGNGYFKPYAEGMIINDIDITYEQAQRLFECFKLKRVDTNVECVRLAWEESKLK